MMPALAPLLLRHDNFTPPSRTPWGGRRIAREYKASLALPAGQQLIGESWEVSVEPSFASRCAHDDRALSAVLAADPGGWLGPEVARRWGGSLPILVKLLDAADNLSVQVHPEEGDAALAADESGKPESWVVLQADPGAGLYLGFRDSVERSDVADCIAADGALDQLMQFVPVSAGDAFVIEAGTPHAIGAGLTLIEPQLVQPGRRGLTYRFWDWNRRYDAVGRADPAGRPRELHLARSFEVTRWQAPRGEAFVASCRSPSRILSDGGVRREQVVDWRWFAVERWSGTGTLLLQDARALWALCCVGGALRVHTEAGTIELHSGQSCVVPASAGAFEVQARDALVIATRPRADVDSLA